jgi:hypothetical protein
MTSEEDLNVHWMPEDDTRILRVSAAELLRRNGFAEYEGALDLIEKFCPNEACLLSYVLDNIHNISGALQHDPMQN